MANLNLWFVTLIGSLLIGCGGQSIDKRSKVPNGSSSPRTADVTRTEGSARSSDSSTVGREQQLEKSDLDGLANLPGDPGPSASEPNKDDNQASNLPKAQVAWSGTSFQGLADLEILPID